MDAKSPENEQCNVSFAWLKLKTREKNRFFRQNGLSFASKRKKILLKVIKNWLSV